MLEHLKEDLYRLHLELPKHDLVVWTGGNVSARDPETGLVAIKPSGVRYEQLRPEHMVVLDLEGHIVEGDLKPSSDTYSHLYIYRHRPDVGGGWCTPTPAMPRLLPPSASRFRSCSLPSPTSLADRSRVAAFPSLGMSQLAKW